MSNDPINFRPNDQDRRILDKIKTYLTKATKQQSFDTAAIRYLLRDWDEKQEEK